MVEALKMIPPGHVKKSFDWSVPINSLKTNVRKVIGNLVILKDNDRSLLEIQNLYSRHKDTGIVETQINHGDATVYYGMSVINDKKKGVSDRPIPTTFDNHHKRVGESIKSALRGHINFIPRMEGESL